MSPSPIPMRRGLDAFDQLRVVVLGGRAHRNSRVTSSYSMDRGAVRARELGGPRHDRVQHRLEVEGGADRLADLAERPQLRRPSA